jgi:hypothetical protein
MAADVALRLGPASFDLGAHMNHRNLAGAALAASLVLVGAVGCGSDDAGEKAGEKLAEEITGGDVDINTDDGSVKVTDKDGNTSEYGSGAELPEDWPAELALPEGVTVLGSSTRTENGVETMFITGESETALDDLYEEVKGQLTDANFEIVNDSNMSSTSGGFASVEANSDEYTVNVTISENPTSNKTSVLYNVAQNQA